MWEQSEDVGDAALGVLGTMTQLRQLALPKCYNLTGAALAAAVRGLTRLTSLTLTALPLCGEHVASMVACLMSLSNLQVCLAPRNIHVSTKGGIRVECECRGQHENRLF